MPRSSPAPSITPASTTAEWGRLSTELRKTLGTPGFEAVLHQALARVAASASASRASIQIMNPRTGRLRVAAVHGMSAELLGCDVSTARSISEWVLSHRRGLVLHGQVRDERFEGRTDAGVDSSMCLPLSVAGDAFGVLSLARPDSDKRFTDEDLAAIGAALDPIAELLGRVCDDERGRNAIREHGPVAGADPLHAQPIFESRQYEFAMSHRGSWMRSGDRCGLLAHADGSFTIYVADVPGDGVSAANLGGWIEGVLVTAAAPQRSPAGIIAQVETHLAARFGPGVAVALWVAQLGRRGEITSCAAGLPPPLWIPSDGGPVLRLSRCGALLGAPSRGVHLEEEVRLLPGDTLVALTDGIVLERNAAGEPFGDTRAAEALDEARGESVDRIASGLCGAVAAFSGRSRPLDDLLALAIRYRPGS